MTPTPYASVLATNLRIARAAADLSQAAVGERMRALGYTAWLRQTMGQVEKSKRRVTAEELLALSLVLGTTVGELAASPGSAEGIELASGASIPPHRLTINDRSVTWDGNVPRITDTSLPFQDPARPLPGLTAEQSAGVRAEVQVRALVRQLLANPELLKSLQEITQ